MIPEFFSVGMQVLTVVGAVAGSYTATRIHLSYMIEKQKKTEKDIITNKEQFDAHREDYIAFKTLTEYQLKELKK